MGVSRGRSLSAVEIKETPRSSRGGPRGSSDPPLPKASQKAGWCPPALGGTLSRGDDRLTPTPQPATPTPHLPPPGLGLQIPGPYLAALWRGFARIRERGRRKEEGRTGKKRNRRGVGRRKGGGRNPAQALSCLVAAFRVGVLGLSGIPAGASRHAGKGILFSRRRTVKICLGWPIFSFAPIKRKSPRNSIKATLAKALFEA